MMKKADLLLRLELMDRRYTILRRAVQQRMDKIPKKYTLEEIQKLSNEMEGASIEGLKKIHKKWIGF